MSFLNPKASLIFLILCFGQMSVYSQKTKTLIGAYYFDGWTGAYNFHITPSLRDSFSFREPKWGWINSNRLSLHEQAKIALKNDIDFFTFCWYFTGRSSYINEPRNNALKLFSGINTKLKYCLLVVNQVGYNIDPVDWDFLSSIWISHFKSKKYLKINNAPVIIFFSVSELLKKFSSTSILNEKLNELKVKCYREGIEDLKIGLCLSGKQDLKLLPGLNFDFFTSYNNHELLKDFDTQTNKSVDNTILLNREMNLWNDFNYLLSNKYYPGLTISWDPRPWANSFNGYQYKAYTTPASVFSVATGVNQGLGWINRYKNKNDQNLFFLYAWNELGEGAFLLPTKNGNNLSIGVKKGVTFNRNN